MNAREIRLLLLYVAQLSLGMDNGGKINDYKGTRNWQLGTTLKGEGKEEDKGIFRMVSLALGAMYK